MDKFNTHQVTMGIKKSIKQQNSKQKRHIAPKSKEFRSWILRKVIAFLFAFFSVAVAVSSHLCVFCQCQCLKAMSLVRILP